MDRAISDELIKWKNDPDRKPLILEGIRQCGKTHILKEFGDKYYKKTAYVNFEETPEVASFFDLNLDPFRITEALSSKLKIDIDDKTLIIFDEIQTCGKALTSLKYFNERMPHYSIVCAGSLLGLLHSTPTSFPVGKVDFLKMYPLSFPEFMVAMGERDMHRYITSMPKDETIPDAFFTTLNKLYYEYCFVGGMPEAVLSWKKHQDPDRVRKVQDNIIRLYQSDFAKYAPLKDVKKIISIWSSIPAQLSKENKKFIFGHAVEGGRARDLEDALQWLIDAGMVHRVNLLSVPRMPLSAYCDLAYFKLYCADIGLLGAMANLRYSSIISDDAEYREFKGAMTENYVLTELVKLTDKVPYYWRKKSEAEIDFVHTICDRIVPIEVKAGSYRRLRSMESYMELYNTNTGFVISLDGQHSGNITSVPLPLVWKMQDRTDTTPHMRKTSS